MICRSVVSRFIWVFFVLFLLNLTAPSPSEALQEGAILFRTSGDGEMPGRARLPGASLTNPFLQIPCDIYEELIFGRDTKTGHAGLYIGLRDGDQMVIEADTDNNPFGSIVDTPLSSFVDEDDNQIFVGAKMPTGTDVHDNGLPEFWVDYLILLAIAQLGEDYDGDFSHQKGPGEDEWICVGLTEKLYESCDGLNLKPDFSGSAYAYDITSDGYSDGPIGPFQPFHYYGMRLSKKLQ